MIIATAGHVDHGKTSLIRQLTGVETDRLAEEQRRGLSISLGYAYLPTPGFTPLGFIDVPGHQRFINTMISGISGIDMGMLVIAADDGPMPQTHEHMDVLQLLGIRQLVVVITKTDRVSPERVAEVTREIETLLADRPWPDTVIFPVSNVDGAGIGALKTRLLARATADTERSTRGYFRLSIDRCFTAKGAGLVVTGTASAGAICTGNSLTLLPQNIELRVRGIRVHDESADKASAGERCALNLAGKLEAESISKGDWLVETGTASASRRVDVRFTLLNNAPFALKHLAPVKMYIGAKRIAGRLALLSTDSESDSNRLQPGGGCLAQLLLDEELTCCRGERFLLRDHAEDVILGGGIILDPSGLRSGKSRPQRIAWLNAMMADSPTTALNDVLAQGQLVNLDQFRLAWNLRTDELAATSVADSHEFEAGGSRWLISQVHWHKIETQLLMQVNQWHQGQPQSPGIKATQLKSEMEKFCSPVLAMAALSALLQSRQLVLRNGLIRRANFQAVVSQAAANRWQQFEQCLKRGGNQIPLLSEIEAATGMTQSALIDIAKAAVRRGELHCVTERRYALPDQLHKLANALLTLDQAGESITVIAMKAQFGTGRNLTIEILEYFDRVHFTRRKGDRRIITDRELPMQLYKR